MISETIRCSCCGYQGPREMSEMVPEEPARDLFLPQGHDPYSGSLYFQCPRCRVVVAVDPMEALAQSILSGHPLPLKSETGPAAGKSCPLSVLGGLYSGLTLFFLFVKLLH